MSEWHGRVDEHVMAIKIPRANDAGPHKPSIPPQCPRIPDFISRNLMKFKRLNMLNWPTLYHAPA
jgi:hypothetical protein